MSSTEIKPTTGKTIADQFQSIMAPDGKGTVPAAELSDGVHLELGNVSPQYQELDPEQDIMQLARLGDIQSIKKLYDADEFGPSYCDAEGITPLHWAAINNQYAMCQFLIQVGVDVNQKGGESVATPAMWAAQRCHYYTVHLLLQHGADPLLTDVQGYNILHLATFEGNIFLLVLLLHQNIPVDVPDSHGHTCLMWAAYKGFPSCVDLFLGWGADVNCTDDTGFTALHWALVKGSQGCIQKLVEYGADRFARTLSGKTPEITADEMKTDRIWRRALNECGYDEDGFPLTLDFPMSSWILKDKRAFMNRFFFLWPFLVLWVMVLVVSHMVVYAGVPMALLAGYGLQWVAQQFLKYAPSDMRHLHKTPWLAGIFGGTLFLAGLRYLTHILPATYYLYPYINLAFVVFYSLCAYFYVCTMLYEPGYVQKAAGLSQQKAVIDELITLWKFDDQNFCVACMVRMPLRSKHCKRCNRCVAKHDHHCPWVYNCIGVNNHRHFFLYLLSLETGILLLLGLAVRYYQGIIVDTSPECNVLAPGLCQVVNADTYTLVLVTWSALQLTWVTMLMFVQLVQISRAMTTWENMRGAHQNHSSKASEAIMSSLIAGTTTQAGAQLGSTGLGPDPMLRSTQATGHHHHSAGCFAQWKKILGVDSFVETALNGYEAHSHTQRNVNLFSGGVISNCKDFWCDPAPVFGKRENGQAMLRGEEINYTTLYVSPQLSRRIPASANWGNYETVTTNDVV